MTGGIWVLSQSGCSLVLCTLIEVHDSGIVYGFSGTPVDESGVRIGKYASKERATEVLLSMRGCIPCPGQPDANSYFEMPEK